MDTSPRKNRLILKTSEIRIVRYAIIHASQEFSGVRPTHSNLKTYIYDFALA